MQVKDCIEAAKMGREYQVPSELSVHLKSTVHRQAVENMGTEEMRKKPPDLHNAQNTAQQVGNVMRDGEIEVWEGDHKALLLFGESKQSTSTQLCRMLTNM